MQEKPFSKGFVLRITLRHMRRSIDISIRKTFERFQDFDNNSETGLEIMETLDVLHKMKKMIDDFQEANAHLFKEDN